MIGLDSDNFRNHRKNLDHVHKLARDMGMADEDLQLAEIAQLELKFSGPWETAMAVSQLVYRWRKSRNPHYMDLAMLVCQETGVQPPPAVIQAFSEAANERFNGDPKGKPTTIKKESDKWRHYTLMMNLIYHGLSLPRAASKAARYMKDQGIEQYRHVSSLEKQYPKEVRATGIEKQHFDNWDKWLDEPTRQAWRRIIELLPEAEDFQKGGRR